MAIEKVLAIPGRGQVLVGTVERGILKKNDIIEIVGHDVSMKSAATEIHVFKNLVNECRLNFFFYRVHLF